MTKQELQQYYWTKRNIEKLEQRLEELHSMAESITTHLKKDADSIQGKGTTSDKVGNLVAEMEDIRVEIIEEIEYRQALLRVIEQSIKRLPAREAYLIRARYIEHQTWEEIAVDMHYSWKQVHNIHSGALKELAEK